MSWSLSDLADGASDPGAMPSREETEGLMREFHRSWIPPRGPSTLSEVTPWVIRRLNLDDNVFSWTSFKDAMTREKEILRRLHLFLKEHGCMDGECKSLLFESCNAIFTVQDMFKQQTRMLANLSPHDEAVRQFMDPDDFQALDFENENVFCHNEKDNTSFQNAFFHLRHILEGCGYRRAQGKFYKRIQLRFGSANAYEVACTVDEFISDNTAYFSNFKAFRWVTHPYQNYKQLVDFLSERPLLEAPDLKEDRHIRSYAGDAEGRGSGIYNHACDMFFPYDKQDQWESMANDVQSVRRRLFDPKYECRVPSLTDVCLIHLNVVFPHDIHAEVTEIDPNRLYVRWVEVEEYECRHGRHFSGFERWRRRRDPLPGGTLVDVPHELIQKTAGGAWSVVDVPLKKASEASKVPHAYTWVDGSYAELVDTAPELNVPDLGAFLSKRADETYAASGRGKPLPRVDVTDDEWARFEVDPVRVTARTYVRDGSRCFRVHTGMRWSDIHTPEFDHIYACQDFVRHDEFMLWGTQGRVFYKVGERDNYDGTIAFIGIGGSGKSTIIKFMQKFWPKHRRGNLSANIQSQFGMAEVAHGDVAWCTELSESPNMPQEDWQDATSGHCVVCPVKHKQEPIVVDPWEAQFWWAGNTEPTKYRNDKGQVTRRLYGTYFLKVVKPRRDDILKSMEHRRGWVQRKAILAYDDWLMQMGNIDPNSVVDDLPPAFKYFQIKMKRDTDPFMDFLSDAEYVEVDTTASPIPLMPLTFLRELYNEFRLANDMGRSVKWCEDVYRRGLMENGVEVKVHDMVWRGEQLTGVKVVSGLRESAQRGA